MNTRLNKLIETQPIRGGYWLDAYNQYTSEIAGTIITQIDHSCNYFIAEPIIIDMNEDKTVLGWTRDKKGKVVNRHPVSVANAVTANKHDNTQNYVVEPFVVASRGRGEQNTQQLEARTNGVTNTLTSVQKDNYVVNPKRGQTEMGVQEGFSIRKLTPRECFRLMGCDEPTIDKLLSAGISNSQLYKLAGNSIVVDVLYHIFRRMFVDTDVQQGEHLVIF